MGYGYRVRPRVKRTAPPTQQNQNLPKFVPEVTVFAGYGFPNLDKLQFPDFYGYYRGSAVNTTGPLAGSVDYRFSRHTSVGIMVVHGKTGMPYYDMNGSAPGASFTGTLDNWAVMLNLMNYIPVQGTTVSPYIRTAVGANIWKEDYMDVNGGHIPASGAPSDLAYQLSLGTTFNLSKHFGLFAEVGYGKYIVMGGLACKF